MPTLLPPHAIAFFTLVAVSPFAAVLLITPRICCAGLLQLGSVHEVRVAPPPHSVESLSAYPPSLHSVRLSACFEASIISTGEYLLFVVSIRSFSGLVLSSWLFYPVVFLTCLSSLWPVTTDRQSASYQSISCKQQQTPEVNIMTTVVQYMLILIVYFVV